MQSANFRRLIDQPENNQTQQCTSADQRRARWLCLAGLAPLLLTLLIGPSAAASREKITVTVGQSVIHRVPTRVKTVSIADSDVADVVVASPFEILLNGKAIGFTTVVIWDEGQVSTSYDVVVRSPFSGQQIELRVKVAELNRTSLLDHGVDFLVQDDEENAGGAYGGEVAPPAIPLQLFGGKPAEGVSLALRYLHEGRDFSAMIRALQAQGFLRVLAEPNLVAATGQTASFLAGGEIPVPVATAGGQGGTTVTVEWKEFGVRISFLPTIVDSGVVNLRVTPEVSSLDYGNGIVLSGFRIPALRSRRAETTVELKDGEILVVGGLIMEEESENVRRVPILGHIPLLGLLFQSKQKSLTELELLLVVSVHIVNAMAPGTEVELPGVVEVTELPLEEEKSGSWQDSWRGDGD